MKLLNLKTISKNPKKTITYKKKMLQKINLQHLFFDYMRNFLTFNLF
jgi:hypothetical protein